ncbi:ABC transporter ATP-binding protein [uncultured Clostridium sp.]|uniref:ABC transporter ATP-binding protein n=1 Tax=uncultured Clostridium sp. TaxID=59620 RepID=UPI002672E820|nr:ABC transporter ATP-binding protein [uncultured Clostridium sp.]
MLKVNDVEKKYKLKNKDTLMAINGVSFNIKKGSCVGVVGESGCGKTTLGRMIVGIEPYSNGNIEFKGKDVRKIKRKDPLRKELQMIFQDSLSAVNRRISVKEILAEPINNFYKISKEELNKKVDDLLLKVGIDSNDKNKYPNQFSGGQLQRVCIARALASNPSLIVLDEPLSSLDVSIQAQVLNLLSDLKSELELTYMFISHDLEAVYYLSDSIIIMYRGKIMEQIDDIELFHDMKHPYTIKLLSSSYEYRSKIANKGIEMINYEFEDVGCPYFNRCKSRNNKCKEVIPTLREIGDGHKIACHMIK